MNVGEVAASAAGDQDFLPYAFGSFDYRDPPSALASLQGAHQACGAAAEHQRVKLQVHQIARLYYDGSDESGFLQVPARTWISRFAWNNE